jgi:hypothetical protein
LERPNFCSGAKPEKDELLPVIAAYLMLIERKPAVIPIDDRKTSCGSSLKRHDALHPQRIVLSPALEKQ